MYSRVNFMVEKSLSTRQPTSSIIILLLSLFHNSLIHLHPKFLFQFVMKTSLQYNKISVLHKTLYIEVYIMGVTWYDSLSFAFKNGLISHWNYCRWGSKIELAQKFMEVEVDMKCMETNFGGWVTLVLEFCLLFICLQNGQIFPLDHGLYSPWGSKNIIVSTKSCKAASRGWHELHANQF